MTISLRALAVTAVFGAAARGAPLPAVRFQAAATDAPAILARLSKFADAENAWIASLQLTNGALAEAEIPANGEVAVNPYFADLAMMALLEEGPRYAGSVKAYLDWHFAHLNSAAQDVNHVAGTIYDYTVVMKNGAMRSEKPARMNGLPSYDSTDSYAATFLSLLAKYAARTGDAGYVAAHAGQIGQIADAMLATLQTNGLTQATPAYPVQYLMDNCEVFQGLAAAVILYEGCLLPLAGNSGDVQTAYAKILTVRGTFGQAIEAWFWNAGGGHYESSLEDGRPAETFAWTTYYQSAVAQLFPVACGVIPPSSARARALYLAFCGHYRWEALSIPDEYYWAHNAYAAALMGDADRTLAFLGKYRTKAATREYPLYNAEAGWAVLAAHALSNALVSASASNVWCATITGVASNAAVTLLGSSAPSATPDAFGSASFWLPPGSYLLRVDRPGGDALETLSVISTGKASATDTALSITGFSGNAITNWTPAALSSDHVQTLYSTNLASADWTTDASITNRARAVFLKLRVK